MASGVPRRDKGTCLRSGIVAESTLAEGAGFDAYCC